MKSEPWLDTVRSNRISRSSPNQMTYVHSFSRDFVKPYMVILNVWWDNTNVTGREDKRVCNEIRSQKCKDMVLGPLFIRDLFSSGSHQYRFTLPPCNGTTVRVKDDTLSFESVNDYLFRRLDPMSQTILRPENLNYSSFKIRILHVNRGDFKD